MKIAITGHSSGIGEEIYNILDLTMPDVELRGYSKSNGWNLASNDGDDIINDIIDYDPDVVFNNAYYPKIQNKILEVLYNTWKDQSKVIINTGSISGHLGHSTLEDQMDSMSGDYIIDKKNLSNFCIANSFNYYATNKTRIQNVSLGFTNTPLLTRAIHQPDQTNMINCEDAAFFMVDLIEWDKPYLIPEFVINGIYKVDNGSTGYYFDIASRNMVKHIARSNRKLKNQNKSST